MLDLNHLESLIELSEEDQPAYDLFPSHQQPGHVQALGE